MAEIIISEATPAETLDGEWDKININHYGGIVVWTEKKFRFKAEVDGAMVGTIDGKFEAGVVYVSTLMTKEAYRGKGIGSRLLARAEEFGRENKAHRIWLLTGKHWDENIFYQKLGFELIAQIPDFYFHKDFVVYSKEIR